MPGQPSDAPRFQDDLESAKPAFSSLDGQFRLGRRRQRRDDWRRGGRAVAKWDGCVLGSVLAGVGVGAIGSVLADRLLPGVPIASTVALWTGLVAATVFAFMRARPSGLLRIRPTDLLWGLGLGLSLRFLQGWMSGAGASSFPSMQGFDGPPPPSWWVTDFLLGGFVGPIVEEFSFRAVLLVSVYQLLRRSVGTAGAAVTGLLVSAGVFVIVHGIGGVVTLADGVMLFFVGATSALVVLLTGRLWGAVFLHVVYNITYLALEFVGTALA